MSAACLLRCVGWLAGLALVLSPAARGLAGSLWLRRRPRAAVTVWCAWGAVGGIGVLAIPLSVGRSLAVGHWVGLSGAVMVPAPSGPDLLTGRDASPGVWDGAGGVALVVEAAVPLAYCVAGFRRPTVVLTRGCREMATATELRAIVAHERAHARGHHGLVIGLFLAWERTFPVLIGPRLALAAVTAATEMTADDAAVRAVGPAGTVRAIRRLSPPGNAGPDGVTWRPDPRTLARVRRLIPAPGRGVA